VFYGWTTESVCKAACLSSPSCVAIDLGPVGCVLHNNASDLATAYYAAGVTHFVLSRICEPTSPLSTTSPLTTTSSVHTTAGMSLQVKFYLLSTVKSIQKYMLSLKTEIIRRCIPALCTWRTVRCILNPFRPHVHCNGRWYNNS